LIEKIETLVNCVTVHRTMNAPNTDTAPTSTGSPAATTPPNTTSSNSSVRGTAIISARARSPSIVSPIAAKTASEPARPTVMPSRSRPPYSSRIVSIVSTRAGSSSAPGNRIKMSARSPSTDRSGAGDPSDQYDTTSSVPSSAANSSVNSVPAATTSSASTSPRVAVTIATKSALPVSNSSSSVSIARVDSELGSSKPPFVSWANTPVPSTMATTRPSRVLTSTSRRRRTTR
jgi:hypothetical protein